LTVEPIHFAEIDRIPVQVDGDDHLRTLTQDRLQLSKVRR